MSTRAISVEGLIIYDDEIIEKHWREDKFGELTDEKLKLLADNIKAVHEGHLYDDIEHVLDVWESCGIQ